MLELETGLSPPFNFTDRSKGVLLLKFVLIVIMCPLPVSLWRFVDFVLNDLMDVCWEGADLLAFRLCCLTLCCLDFWVLSRMGKEVEFDCIGSWSSPFNPLQNFYLPNIDIDQDTVNHFHSLFSGVRDEVPKYIYYAFRMKEEKVEELRG